MENQNFYQGEFGIFREHRRKNRIFFGIAVVCIGILLMLERLHVLSPYHLTLTWPLFLIVVGVLIGIKNKFRRNAWWVLIAIGIANEIPQFVIWNTPSSHLFWPLMMIVGGLVIVFRPRRERFLHKTYVSESISQTGLLEVDVVFGGKKEIVTSKNFLGGVVTSTFGGVELNLVQADFTTPSITLDFKVTFGGLELVVPSHWEVKNEINAVFGGIEDHRVLQSNLNFENRKILILTGSCVFGGIEIKSY